MLSAGEKYRIVDFRTKHNIPNTTDVNVGPAEPLIVTAISKNKLSILAYSESYPQDIIHYELVDSSTAGGDKGRIVYRKDAKWNIAMYEDWRHIKYRRWETAKGSGKYWVNHAPGLERRVVIAGGGGDTIVLQHNLYYPIQAGDSFSFNGGQAQYTVTSINDAALYGYPGHDAITSAGISFPRIIPTIAPTDFIEYRYRETPGHKDMLILASHDPGSNSIHSLEIGRTTLSPDQLTNSIILQTTAGTQAHDVRCGSDFLGNTNSGNSMVHVASDGIFLDNIYHINAVQAGFNFNHNIITNTSEVRSSRLGTNFSNNILDFGLVTYISVIDDFTYNTITGNIKTGQSLLSGLNFGENIFNNHWYSARLLESNLAGGEFNLNRMAKCELVQNTIGSHFNSNWIHADIKNSEIGPDFSDIDFGTLPFDGKSLHGGRSNFYANIDISGSTALDMTQNDAKYAGIIHAISGNAKENINLVLNSPGRFPVRIMPAAGLTLTVTGTPYASINADGQILLNAASRVLDGNKRDYIEFERATITNGNGTFTVVRENSVRIGM